MRGSILTLLLTYASSEGLCGCWEEHMARQKKMKLADGPEFLRPLQDEEVNMMVELTNLKAINRSRKMNDHKVRVRRNGEFIGTL